MKAVIVDRYGDASSTRLGDVAEPQLGPHDVLVEVHAAGVNPLDIKVRDGEFKAFLPYRAPFVLGHDVAGVVTGVGGAVTRFSVGDEVYGRPRTDRIGTFAERIGVHEDDLAPKPVNLSMAEAASLPLVALTAWQALVERARVRPGQKVLIHAGSGGVGTIALQLARHLGLEVATTVGPSNVELVRDLGADVVIDYRAEDFADVLSGYDVVLDSLGGASVEKSLRVLAPGGVVISIGGPPDPAFGREIGTNPVVRLVMGALSLRVRRAARRRGVSYGFLFMHADGQQLREITELVETGRLRPVVGRLFPFADALEALAYIEHGPTKPGKVVLTLR